MNIEDYLKFIQTEYGYAHPLQTRPKPSGGITKQKSDESSEQLGVRGPVGAEVDLDQDMTIPSNRPFKYKYKEN